jgi:hypothetical protein
VRVINEAQPDEGDGEDPPLPAERKGEKPQECAQDHKPDGRAKNQTSLTGSIIPADFSSTRGTQTMAR